VIDSGPSGKPAGCFFIKKYLTKTQNSDRVVSAKTAGRWIFRPTGGWTTDQSGHTEGGTHVHISFQPPWQAGQCLHFLLLRNVRRAGVRICGKDRCFR